MPKEESEIRSQPSAEHPALSALKDLAQRAPSLIRPEDSWPIGQMDPSSIKEAAVLLLLGVLDQAAAQDTSCAKVGSDLDLLVLVRSKNLRHHAGQAALPGGRIDPEDYQRAVGSGLSVEEVAALREAEEETGLKAAGVRLLGKLPALDLPVSNYRVTPVLGWWDLPTPVEVTDSKESTLVVRLPVADLLNPANRLTATVTRGRTRHKSPAFDVSGDFAPFTIWGFTGHLLSRVFEELGWEEPWDRKRTREIGS